MQIGYDNCKDCVSGCEHAGKDREFVYSLSKGSCKKIRPKEDSAAKALECIKTLVNFCHEQMGCKNCIFHLLEPGCWECNLKELDPLDMTEIKANIYAKQKENIRRR